MQGFYEKFNVFGEWLYRLVLLNFLWIGFSILGAGILGVFPATAAIFSLLRKWMLQGKDVKLLSDFGQAYRNSFLKANVLGYGMVVLWLIIWADIQLTLQSTSLIGLVMTYILFGVLIYVSIASLMGFAIYVHYELTINQYFLQMLKYPITHVKESFILIATLLIYCTLLYYGSSIIPFIGVTLLGFVIAKVIFPTFKEQKKKNSTMYEQQRDELLYY
ncbi:YesL family protein [Viridibacillus arvi]|uniref:YesL family protein n=1 Tax=Viridibacillus arvi TaxID=263475 RepID=UPI0036E10240